jgi:hypothetical protein
MEICWIYILLRIDSENGFEWNRILVGWDGCVFGYIIYRQGVNFVYNKMDRVLLAQLHICDEALGIVAPTKGIVRIAN